MLRRRDSGESDRRLTALTLERGVIDVVAKGARKGASRLAGSSEPLSACILHVAEGKKNAFVTQVQPVSTFPGLRSDYERLTYGLVLAELAAAVLPHEQALPEAFTFFVEAMKYLECHEKPLVALVWAQARLLEQAGFFPELDICVETGDQIGEATPYLSPMAGGYVSPDRAMRFTDRFTVRAEVVYGLRAIVTLDQPPATLRFAEDCLAALFPFWRAVADKPLPAAEACVQEVLHG